MIKGSLDSDNEINITKILIIPVPDINVHALWTNQIDLLVPRERGIKVIEPQLYKRELFSATEIRSRIVNDENWKKLVTPETLKVIQDVYGIRRIKAIFAKKTAEFHDIS